jgi:hypothetical protein
VEGSSSDESTHRRSELGMAWESVGFSE